ncbi:LysE family translocator [Glutamicibacter ardleyensis]|uniref:LysE family translocator n=1 Tax=Glutamicibacter ardleyensis TaxID=225894 RepID=UPI003FD66DF4
MEQFAAVALAHFLALLIPGVDFFLIARTAMTSGWRNATGACLGIAAANGIFIAAAFSGISIISHPTVLVVIQLAGGAFLVFIGIAFMRSTPRLSHADDMTIEQATWVKNFGLGIASGLLNPKNALFYLSLATALAGAAPLTLVAYGTWMFTIVLVWDVIIAVALGSRRALARLARVVPWLTKIAGGFLILFGIALIVAVVQ